MNAFYLLIRDLKEWKQLTHGEQVELFKRIQKGDKGAREKLICCNAPLAINIASKFRISGVTLEDKIQEALATLVNCVDHWNPDKSRFSTYVYAAIHFRLCRMVRYERLIQVPYNMPMEELVTHPREGLPLDVIDDELMPTACDPFPSEIADDIRELQDGVANLPPRLRSVILARLRGETLKEIGDRIGVTKERVRQLEKRAKAELRLTLTGATL